MRTLIPWLVACLLGVQIQAQPLTAAEYFIDADPGVGNGIAYAITSGDVVDAAFTVDASAIPVGFHTLSLRFKDADGQWGHAVARLFYVYGDNGGGGLPAGPITAGEYFIDTDPGVGGGTAFSVAQGNTVSAAFTVDASAVSIGFHTLSMRFKDVDGRWGHTEARLFYVYGTSGGSGTPAGPITAAEYFFDTDPGVGNGTALPTGAPQDAVSLNTIIDASALAVGTHTLGIRIKDLDGRWGHVDAKPFVILEPGALANDECLAATPLTLHDFGACPSQGTAGSTEEATASGNTACWGGAYNDVWYTVHSGESPSITLDLTEVTAQDLRVEVYDGCGGNLLQCISYSPYTFNTDLNTTYWLRVYGAVADGSFGICASAAQADCLGELGGPAMPGAVCDDGLASTINDQYQPTCTCQGWDCAGVLGGSAGPGTPCDYYTTGDGIYDTSCNCTYPEDCEGTPGGPALPGTPCDDGLASTVNDAWSNTCSCVGYDCLGVEGGSTGPGSPCPMGWYPAGAVDPVLGADCQCTWTDCMGVVNGTDLPGSSCDDGLATTGNDAWDSNCECHGELIDCAGVPGGSAYLDNCTTCVGGSTGISPCTQDCNNEWGGTAYLDNCSICVGGSTGLEPCALDCHGDFGGTAFVDNCGTCVGGNTGLTACAQDCHGDWGGAASIDLCSVCSGGNTGIVPNSTCLDCAGVPNGPHELDACGNCLLPSDPGFETAVRTLTYVGTGNFQNSVLFPQTGEPSNTYTADVIYTDSENGTLPLGYPRLILDFEGDGIFNGPFDRTVLMVATDANDVTTNNGKRYRGTAVGLPVGTNYQTRIQVDNGGCVTQVGPFNYPDVLVAPDLEIFANDIWFSDPNPDVNSPLTVFARVHNNADYPAENFVVHLVNEFEPGTAYPDITVPYLGPRDTLTVSWNIITPNTVAWCPMHVTVDHTNAIAETNELNNRAIRPFTNGEYNLPGTIHVYAEVSPEVSEVDPNGPITWLSVSGYAYYSGTAVELADSSVAGATVTITGHYGETYMALTNSNGYFQASFLCRGTEGIYNITGEVTDYTLTGILNAPYERVLSATPCYAGFTVGVQIDQVMNVNGIWRHAIVAGASISGMITIHNSTCEDVTIPTRLDVSQTGGLPMIGDAIVPPLVAGASFSLPFSGVVFDTPGYYHICGTSDADFELADPSYHNTYCAPLTVYPALPDIVPAGGGGFGNTFLCQSSEANFGVWNHGAIPTGPFTCEVDVYLNGGFIQTFAHAVDDIDAFSSIAFSIPYQPPVVGEYTFNLRCDVPLPSGMVVELSESNNTASYNSTLTACQADLYVYFPCDTPVTPDDPAPPGTVLYHAVVGNYGNATAQGPIDVHFEVSSGGIYAVQYPGDLAPGETATVQVNAPAIASATASLTAAVDPMNTVPEFNEGGDTTDELCHEYYPTVCPGGWGWPSLPVLGQTTPVSVVLASSHLYTASQVKVRFEVSGPDISGTALLGDVLVDPEQARCYCGVGVTLPGSFLFSSEGTYTFTFTVDPDNEYAECNEGNNVLTRQVTITDLPDLRVLSQYINPSLLNPDVNEFVTLDVTYENIGYGNLGSTFDLKVMANNDELATVADVPGLVTGGTNTVSIPVPFSSPLVGVHVFRAIIDAQDEVLEVDELNNEATRAIVVGAAANLYFESFMASTNDPSLGQFMNFSAIVRNNGDVPIGAQVQFYYVTQGLDTVPFNVPLNITVDSSGFVGIGSYWTVTQIPRAIVARIINGSVLEFTYSDNEVSRPMGLLNVQLTSIPGCPDVPFGSLTVSVNGGVAPYSFAWDNDSTGQVLHAPPGAYEVVITDAEGRTSVISGTITLASDCEGEPLDCAGVPGGTAFMDECGTCVGGSTGEVACTQDCHGDWGGTAFLDGCDTCVGGNTGLEPCAPTCTENITIELRTDPQSQQASWEVLDANDQVVCQFAVTLSGITDPIVAGCCLDPGCYRLRVYDSGGDGFVSAGITGGYQLRESGASGRRIIDNMGNFLGGGNSSISSGYDNGAFCLPIGEDQLLFSSCDKLDWLDNRFIVCHANDAVSAQYGVTNSTSGYEFWFFDPNGSYNFRRFRSHATSDGYGTGVTRACHFKVNGWINSVSTPHLPDDVLLNVRVRGRVAGDNLPFGPACRFKLDATLAACPRVRLQDDPNNTSDYSCGVIRNFGGPSSPANRIYAAPPQPVPAVASSMVRYQFRFRITGEGTCIVRPAQTSARMVLNWTNGSPLLCGKTYEVDVRVSLDGGTTWCVGPSGPGQAVTCADTSEWGKVCLVTIVPCSASNGGDNALSGTGIEEGPNVILFPNPNSGDQLYLRMSPVENDVSLVTVDIHDLTGKRVMTSTIPVQDNQLSTILELNGTIAGGTYLVHITSGDLTHTERLVIQP